MKHFKLDISFYKVLKNFKLLFSKILIVFFAMSVSNVEACYSFENIIEEVVEKEEQNESEESSIEIEDLEEDLDKIISTSIDFYLESINTINTDIHNLGPVYSYWFNIIIPPPEL